MDQENGVLQHYGHQQSLRGIGYVDLLMEVDWYLLIHLETEYIWFKSNFIWN